MTRWQRRGFFLLIGWKYRGRSTARRLTRALIRGVVVCAEFEAGRSLTFGEATRLVVRFTRWVEWQAPVRTNRPIGDPMRLVVSYLASDDWRWALDDRRVA